jgi:hypothetical protein
MKPSFWQIEAKLLVAAIAVGLVSALAEGRFTPGGVAALLGLTSAVALGIGAAYRRRTTSLIVVLVIVAVLAFVISRVIG